MLLLVTRIFGSVSASRNLSARRQNFKLYILYGIALSFALQPNVRKSWVSEQQTYIYK